VFCNNNIIMKSFITIVWMNDNPSADFHGHIIAAASAWLPLHLFLDYYYESRTTGLTQQTYVAAILARYIDLQRNGGGYFLIKLASRIQPIISSSFGDQRSNSGLITAQLLFERTLRSHHHHHNTFLNYMQQRVVTWRFHTLSLSPSVVTPLMYIWVASVSLSIWGNCFKCHLMRFTNTRTHSATHDYKTYC